MARLQVRLTPRGHADSIEGWAADEQGRPHLNVRVRARPSDGEANASLVALIAKRLGIARSAVRLKVGGRSRLKTLEIDGLSEAEIGQRLGR